MADKTKIEWTDATWSPIRFRVRQDAAAIAEAKGYTSLVQIARKMAGHVGPHCEKVSPGCVNCWSESNCHRCLPSNGTGLPFDRRSRDLVEAVIDLKILPQPLNWKRPRRLFVEDQSDLFGEFIPQDIRICVFRVMAACERHTFQLLTKRAFDAHFFLRLLPPHPHIWLGFSAEDQKRFDARWQYMRSLAAAGWLVWCSAEPLLGTINMGQALKEGLRWVVVGGESGPGARPCNLIQVQSIAEQCKAMKVPCFVKQLGAAPIVDRRFYGDDYRATWPTAKWTIVSHPHDYRAKLKDRKGGDISEWPKRLQVRNFPKMR